MALPSLLWLPEDALARRCRVEDVGTLRAALPGIDAPPGTRVDQAGAQQLAPLALLHLARLAAGDGRAAVEACRELLARAYGPPAASAPPDGGGEWPEWMGPARLGYMRRADAHVPPHTDD